MEKTTQTIPNFLQGFTTTDDLLDGYFNKPAIEPVVEEKTIEIGGNSTDDILARYENKTPETPAEELPKQEEKKEEPVVEVKVEPKKGAALKLPEGFASIVKALDDKKVFDVSFADDKYETIDDLADLIKLNDEHKIEKFKQEAQEQFFGNMNPFMQTIAKYAEMGITSPQQLAPFVTALDNYDYSTQLDSENIEHQELIIRNALEIQGLSKDVIEGEIADLKERDKIAIRAKDLKPRVDEHNRQQVQQLYQQQEQEFKKQQAYLQSHQHEVKKQILDQSNIGGIKLSKEEKTDVYLALSQIDPQLGGFPIYSLIDKLMQEKNFETLAQIWLLGSDQKGYLKKVGSDIIAKQAENTQRELRYSNKSTPVETSQSTSNSIKIDRTAKQGSTFSLNR